MFKVATTLCLVLALLFSLPAMAGSENSSELPQITNTHDTVLHGGSTDQSKATRDSVLLLGPWGSGAPHNGQFQSTNGSPAWNGWSHVDLTQAGATHWHISDYHASNLNSTPDNLALYCGDETFPVCHADDVIGGYGNNYSDTIGFEYTVADANADCEVTVSGVFNHNTEWGYDYTTFQFSMANGPLILATFDGVGQALPFNHSIVYSPDDYVGENNNSVRFEILCTSDGGWSDEDCAYWGNGACQIDDVRVQCSNGNFDHTSDFQNGMDGWEFIYEQGFGDFAELWSGLNELDPCRTNFSSQVAFIDDGTKYPGVGPSYCQNWCYGPQGYIVNTTGGVTFDEDNGIFNAIESPVLNWPAQGYTGANLNFDVYKHEDLSADSPGIFYLWAVRSAVDPIQLENASWQDRNFLYYGVPTYVSVQEDVSDLLEPGLTVFQVQLAVYDLPNYTWWEGDDGYPAPYFDNVRVTAFPHEGPALSTREIDLAQDNFSESGGPFNWTDLSLNNVRFDNSQSKSYHNEDHNVPGDSITCNISSVRTGGELIDVRLVYSMDRNPLFDSVRDPLWSAEGVGFGIQRWGSNEYSFDLPDSGFLFPGDVMHYYFSATDEVNHTDPKTSTIPADLSGFGDFSRPLAYNTAFQVHALPSYDADGVAPELLFWNDFGTGGGQDEWFSALGNLGYVMGTDYDVYHTNGSASGVGNGLGGRATFEQIEQYKTLLYTSGTLNNFTLGFGDPNWDKSPDVQLLTQWFDQRSVGAYFCGNQLASDLYESGLETSEFLHNIMNVTLVSDDIRPLINGQTTPHVLPVIDNSIFHLTHPWLVKAGCPGSTRFDAVEVGDGAERLARFTSPAGDPAYIYSAATLNVFDDDKVISMPYDFMGILTDPESSFGDMARRVYVLREILNVIGNAGFNGTIVDAVGPVGKLTAKNYPNPFNPVTRIDFNLPMEGHLSLKVYNLRGELVKTLIDEQRSAGQGFMVWDGADERGDQSSSGVYFYEIRAKEEYQVGKMVLIK